MANHKYMPALRRHVTQRWLPVHCEFNWTVSNCSYQLFYRCSLFVAVYERRVFWSDIKRQTISLPAVRRSESDTRGRVKGQTDRV